MDQIGYEGESTIDEHHQVTPYNNGRNGKKGTILIKYKECLKNHAASIGGNATDGCGEFMPSGEEGTIEALKCSACNCHRNFHRKEVEDEPSDQSFHNFRWTKNIGRGQKGLLIPAPMPQTMVMQNSESEEIEHEEIVMVERPHILKKRFRTKFTAEQKQKMMDFAERIGWRLQKQDEDDVQLFCQEIGVKRRVLKVWMHNNKYNMAKKKNTDQID